MKKLVVMKLSRYMATQDSELTFTPTGMTINGVFTTIGNINPNHDRRCWMLLNKHSPLTLWNIFKIHSIHAVILMVENSLNSKCFLVCPN